VSNIPSETRGARARLRQRLHAFLAPDASDRPVGGNLAARVAALEEAVEENRRLSQRLADVVDVVTELLVPAMDRDDERVRKALADLDKTLGAG
jgi:hypothetical protein